jgi:hypothetical protein
MGMTRTARVLIALATAGALTLAGTGCGTGTPPPRSTAPPSATTRAASSTTARVTPSGSAAVSPTPPATDPAIVFAADGIGPYLIGTQLSELQGRALVANAVDSQACVGYQEAAPIGRYAGILTLLFTAGRLASIRTTSDTLVTPAGAKVGMALADAQTLYGSRATPITAPSGGKALSVRVTATTLGLVLYLDSTNTKVIAMSGGEADHLETAAHLGEAC